MFLLFLCLSEVCHLMPLCTLESSASLCFFFSYFWICHSFWKIVIYFSLSSNFSIKFFFLVPLKSNKIVHSFRNLLNFLDVMFCFSPKLFYFTVFLLEKILLIFVHAHTDAHTVMAVHITNESTQTFFSFVIVLSISFGFLKFSVLCISVTCYCLLLRLIIETSAY